MSSSLPLSKPAQFVWYELHTADRSAAESFYRDVLGWGARDSGQSERGYTLVSAGDVAIGGILQKPAQTLPSGKAAWVAYIGVDNVDNFSDQVKKAGGFVYRDAEDIPGVGRFAVVADPQGAMFVLFQPENDTQHAPSPDPGSLGSPAWHDLIATDWESAFGFYAELFGWTKSDVVDMGPNGLYQIFAAGPKPIGGMMNRRDANQPPHWLFYFHIEKIGDAIERVKRAGGIVVHGPSAVPGGQQIAHCLDGQGAVFGIVTPSV